MFVLDVGYYPSSEKKNIDDMCNLYERDVIVAHASYMLKCVLNSACPFGKWNFQCGMGREMALRSRLGSMLFFLSPQCDWVP